MPLPSPPPTPQPHLSLISPAQPLPNFPHFSHQPPPPPLLLVLLPQQGPAFRLAAAVMLRVFSCVVCCCCGSRVEAKLNGVMDFFGSDWRGYRFLQTMLGNTLQDGDYVWCLRKLGRLIVIGSVCCVEELGGISRPPVWPKGTDCPLSISGHHTMMMIYILFLPLVRMRFPLPSNKAIERRKKDADWRNEYQCDRPFC